MSGIVFENVCFSYEKGKPILSDISLHIEKGSFLGVIGNNGSGKSTFALLLNGIIPHHIRGVLQGTVIVDGIVTETTSIAGLATKVGLVFQNPEHALFCLSVREELDFGLANLNLDRRDERIASALASVNLPASFLERDPQELSLGQKQKVALACVLALAPDYIVLDEPSSMLDYRSTQELYAHLAGFHQQGKTIVVVEHDTEILSQYATHVALFAGGILAAHGEASDVFAREELLMEHGIKIPHS